MNKRKRQTYKAYRGQGKWQSMTYTRCMKSR
jgi:hypothetical protein